MAGFGGGGSRGLAPGWLCGDQGQIQGHHHLRQGRNISSLEVEDDVLYRHPDVDEAAVIAMPDEKGEVPCAFVKLRRAASSPRPTSSRSAASRWPTSRPQAHHFHPLLPKTSTGKVQKFMLRKQLDC